MSFHHEIRPTSYMIIQMKTHIWISIVKKHSLTNQRKYILVFI